MEGGEGFFLPLHRNRPTPHRDNHSHTPSRARQGAHVAKIGVGLLLVTYPPSPSARRGKEKEPGCGETREIAMSLPSPSSSKARKDDIAKVGREQHCRVVRVCVL